MSGHQRVKICGISDPESARVAADAGADYIGVVFYPGSHRYIDPARAREIADSVHTGSNGQPQIVGLFVNESIEYVLDARERAALDVVQLSGDESPEYIAGIASHDIPFIATVRAGGIPEEETRRRFREIIGLEPYAVHLDTHVPGMWGGSGVVGDWELARDLAKEYRLFLAGGLDPENVAEAVREVRPFVVDVSTGVETDKIKDHEKIRTFIAAARGTEGRER